MARGWHGMNTGWHSLDSEKKQQMAENATPEDRLKYMKAWSE